MLCLGGIINFNENVEQMGLIKTILYIVFFMYAFKFLAKLFAPFLIKKVANKMQEKAAEQFRNQQPKSTVKKGETIIDKAPVKNTNGKNTIGEYVDFEEID
jgi:large-conductance mechanosensitive channel